MVHDSEDRDDQQQRSRCKQSSLVSSSSSASVRHGSQANIFFGGFYDLSRTCQLYRKIGAAVNDGEYETLEGLHAGEPGASSLMEDRKRKLEASERSVRQITLVFFLFVLCFLIMSNVIFVHVADISIPNALLYTAYSWTSTGFGSVHIPQSDGFLIFIIIFMYVGIASVAVMAYLAYIWIALVFSKMRNQSTDQKSSHGKATYKLTNFLVSCANFLADTVRKSERGRIIVFGGYLLGQLFLGTIVMMRLESWSFCKALYFSTYVMTTVGYGDVTPESQGGVLFTALWLPFNISFVSIYMGNLARYFMYASSAMTKHLYEGLVAKIRKDGAGYMPNQELLYLAENTSDANSSAGNKIQTMYDVVNLVLESLCTNHERGEIESTALTRFLRLQSPWSIEDTFHLNNVRKPSFALQVLTVERLVSIIINEVAGHSFDFYEKDMTYFISIAYIQKVARKWKIPAGAMDSFCMLAYDVSVYVGEKRLILEGVDALLRFNPLELHKLFAAVLASFEDAGTVEGWLAVTEEEAAKLKGSNRFARKVQKRTRAETTREDMMDNGTLSTEDILVLLELQKQFDSSFEDQQVMFLARYSANHKLTVLAIVLLLVYETFATFFLIEQTGNQINMGILFTLYTVTSAGFGNVWIPKSDWFLGLAVLNVFISISGLAILVAQTVLYLSFKAQRREHALDKIRVATSGRIALENLMPFSSKNITARDVVRIELLKSLQMIPKVATSDNGRSTMMSNFTSFCLDTELGRNICVASTLLFLLLLGTFAVMVTEGWTFVQGFYFATYGLLTVGHGDLTPVTSAGTWFVVCWMPFNVLFVALYLGSVAHIFVRLSDKNAKRIERNMKLAAKARKEKKESNENNNSGQALYVNDNSDSELSDRRKRLKQDSSEHLSGLVDGGIFFARDLMKQLYQTNLVNEEDSHVVQEEGKNGQAKASQETPFIIGNDMSDALLAPRYQRLLRKAMNDEHFALRLSVLDRVARLISMQLIDFPSTLAVSGSTLRVTVSLLKDWILNWNIPPKARAAYRDVCLETLLFVGEKQIFSQGIQALFDLTAIEFIELFSPFVFALEDIETMEAWLEKTNDIAKNSMCCERGMSRNRRFIKNTVEDYFPANPGNAVRVQSQ